MLDELRFFELGQGPAVVLLHGHPFDRTIWAPQFDLLAAAGFHVVAPDLRGYGETPAIPDLAEMSELAAGVSLLLDRLAIRTAAVIGLSMGGLVAMELVHASPRRFWALGLVATTAAPPTKKEVAQRLEMAETLDAEGMERLANVMSAQLWGRHASPAQIERIDQMMRTNNPVGAAAALRARAHRPDYRPWLSEVTVPTFVCAGTADTWSTNEVITQLVDCLRQPEVFMLQDVGHLPNLEAADAFNNALCRFLIRAHDSDR
jgi:3-oxoadipate enol-lactonase